MSQFTTSYDGVSLSCLPPSTILIIKCYMLHIFLNYVGRLVNTTHSSIIHKDTRSLKPHNIIRIFFTNPLKIHFFKTKSLNAVCNPIYLNIHTYFKYELPKLVMSVGAQLRAILIINYL